VPASPTHAVVLTVLDAHLPALEGLVALHNSPGGELVLIDRSVEGIPEAQRPEGALVVRPSLPSVEDGLAEALKATAAPVACLRHIDGAYPEDHAERLVAALSEGEARVATTAYGLLGADGTVLHVVDPGQDGPKPPPLYDGALALRTDTAVGALAGFPNLLVAYRAAVADEAVARVDGGGFQISMDRFAQARFESDRALRAAEAHGSDYGDETPWASVIVGPGADEDDLLLTLRTLCSQALPPGLFELVLPADAEELLAGLSLPVPVTYAGSGSRGAQLQAAVDQARGYLGIFVSAGLEVWPGLIEHHVRAHRDRPGQLLAAVGTVEIPLIDQARAWGAAVVAADPDGLLSGPAEGELLEARRFHLHNSSVPLEGVRLAGGVSAALPAAGVDADLAWRLERDGYELLVQPLARCLRTAVPTVEEHGAATRAKAAAEVAVMKANPAALDAADCLDQTVESLEAALEPHLPVLPQVVAAAEGMGALGSHAVQAMGGEWAEFADDAIARTGRLLTHLTKVWTMQGRLEGLRALGASSFVDFLKEQPLGLPGRRSTVYLMRPTKEQDLPWLGVIARFLVGFGPTDDATLLLYSDPENGGVEAEELRTAVMELTRRMRPGPNGGWGDIQVAPATGRTGELPRLAAAASGWCPTGSEGDQALQEAAASLGLPVVDTEAWRFRATDGIEPLPIATSARFRALAWPDWTSAEELSALFSTFGNALANREDVALLLRFDVDQDSDPDGAMKRLAEAYEATMPEGTSLDVIVVDNSLGEGDAKRLGAAVQAILSLPSAESGERAALFAGMGVEVVSDEGGLHRAILAMPPMPMGPLYTPTMTLL
jgi:hypothetical protein